jgi:hypothetical protein
MKHVVILLLVCGFLLTMARDGFSHMPKNCEPHPWVLWAIGTMFEMTRNDITGDYVGPPRQSGDSRWVSREVYDNSTLCRIALVAIEKSNNENREQTNQGGTYYVLQPKCLPAGMRPTLQEVRQ